MIRKFRSAVNSVIATLHYTNDVSGNPTRTEKIDDQVPEERFGYCRPEFLDLILEEVEATADHVLRPVLVPKTNVLPWNCGYSEAINAGKSYKNEDQAQVEILELECVHNCPREFKKKSLKFVYFGVFDGHAGSTAAIMASKLLHHHIKDNLSSIQDELESRIFHFLSSDDEREDESKHSTKHLPPFEKQVTLDGLIIGAIEKAFIDMDNHIAREKTKFSISGGCTALVSLFFQGKVYCANAGDSRAIICKSGEVFEMSYDFTPVTERKRLQYIAATNPELLCNEFSHREYAKRIRRRDLGQKILYRDENMTGWTHKIATEDDLKFPLVHGEGKRARLLATIGVTRGLGDHDLKVHDSDIHIKPFLSPVPEVIVYDLMEKDHSEDDVLVMATDGLFDILNNDEIAEIVKRTLLNLAPNDENRYILAAQELVLKARGNMMEKERMWKTEQMKPASPDDITVFIIPLSHHKKPVLAKNSLTESQDIHQVLEVEELT